MQQFVQDVAAGNHAEKGWPNTAYGILKIGVTALTKVHVLILIVHKCIYKSEKNYYSSNHFKPAYETMTHVQHVLQ